MGSEGVGRDFSEGPKLMPMTRILFCPGFALIPSQVTSQVQGTWPSSLHEAFNVTVKTGGKGALATREGG